MNSNNNVFIVGIVALLIGLGGGYVMTANNTASTTTTAQHGSSRDMMAGLESKTGADFETAFMDEMIVHHQSAIDMAELIPERSTRPELRKLGTDIITAQTAEIQMMKQWKAEWMGQTSVNSNDNAEPGSVIHGVQ